jgi:Nucleotidyltransferase domain
MGNIAASIESVLLPHPAIRGVELVGSRADGSPTPLSDWDFVVVTDRFDDVVRALPSLVAELDPLAQQWDRISAYPCYMLMLEGPVKVDLIFPGEPYSRSRPGP